MPVEVFCCYARKDQLLLNELKAHLVPLQREGLITIWADTDIGAGIEWEQEIDKHLNTANIILLLVSPDFMDSDYCYSKEMKRALERHERGDARVIPIILRPVYWQDAPFGKLQALPKDAKPVSSWQDKDEAFLNVVISIRNVVKKLMTKASPILTKTVEQLIESKSPKGYVLKSNTQSSEISNTPTSVSTSAEPLGNSTTSSPRTNLFNMPKQANSLRTSSHFVHFKPRTTLFVGLVLIISLALSGLLYLVNQTRTPNVPSTNANQISPSLANANPDPYSPPSGKLTLYDTPSSAVPLLT